MNKIINKFLLAGDNFMLEMYLRQPEFTYSAHGQFTKNQRIQKFKETGDFKNTHQNKKDFSQHDWSYSEYKYFPRRTVFEKVLCDKARAHNPKYYGYK